MRAVCEQRFKGAPSDDDADIVPAVSVVCRLLLKIHLRVFLLSLTCNCFGCILLCIPAVSSTRAGGRGAERLLLLLHLSGATALLANICLFLGLQCYNICHSRQKLKPEGQKQNKKSAMLRFTMLCYGMLCHAVLCRAVLAMLCFATLCFALLCYAMLC